MDPGSSLGNEVHLDDDKLSSENVGQNDDNSSIDPSDHQRDSNGERSSPELLQINEEESDLDLRFKKPQDEIILNATVKQPVEHEPLEPASYELTTDTSAKNNPKETLPPPIKDEEEFDVISPESVKEREQNKRALIGAGCIVAVLLIGGFIAYRIYRQR